jgi:hypothetical protein
MNTNTFETLQEIFLHDLHELGQLHRRRWHLWPMTRIVKEEHLGRCCYLAEEFLTPTDLGTLKLKVGLDERQWRFYKVKVCGH